MPDTVPIHKLPVPSSSWIKWTTLWLKLVESVGSCRNVLNSVPSKRLRPSSVAIHTKPRESRRMQFTEGWGNPCSVEILLKNNCHGADGMDWAAQLKIADPDKNSRANPFWMVRSVFNRLFKQIIQVNKFFYLVSPICIIMHFWSVYHLKVVLS